MNRPTQTCAQPSSPLSFSEDSLSFSANPSVLFTVRRPRLTVRDLLRFRFAWTRQVLPGRDPAEPIRIGSFCLSPAWYEVTLSVRDDSSKPDAWKEEAQTLRLFPQPCHFGGERYWFACPSCGRSAYALYLAGRFKCRTCAGLRYRSRNWSDNVRLMHHYADLVEGLECRPGPKPRRYGRYIRRENHHGLLGLAPLYRRMGRRRG